MTSRAISLDLSLPPSVNASFANVAGKGRVRTSIYRRWRKAALAEIAVQARGNIFRGTFRISIAASDQGLSRDRDADNLVKAIADAATKAGVIVDDCYRFMRAIDLEWCSTLPAGRCVVEVREISPAPLPKPARAHRQTKPREKSISRGVVAAKASQKPNRREVNASVMRALDAKGIHVAPERIRIQ